MVLRAAATAVVALALVSGAAADGDPASDVLLQQNAFFPIPAPSADAQKALNREVAAAYANGFRVKVAVVASQSDLGAIPSLFNKPADYARFLGTELEFLYVGTLLIVMPDGFGALVAGGTTARARLRGLAARVAARPSVNGHWLTIAATAPSRAAASIT